MSFTCAMPSASTALTWAGSGLPAACAARRWLELFDSYEGSEEASENLKAELEQLPQTDEVRDILAHAGRG